MGQTHPAGWEGLEWRPSHGHPLTKGLDPGPAEFPQTSGELLNFHPHVHVLVTDGGFTADGTFRPFAWSHSQHVERLFRAELLRMLLDKELITEVIVDNLLSWRHSGFSAHGAVRVEDRQGAVRLRRTQSTSTLCPW